MKKQKFLSLLPVLAMMFSLTVTVSAEEAATTEIWPERL